MSFENRYSALDRLLHRLSFSTPSVQIAVADMEDQVFAKQLRSVDISRPVFVTGLPRAGTTLLLEAIESLPDFASHTYRHMPFVLCPMFWSRFSSGFRKSDEARERAHQDGMMVSADSPEAFEEIVWKAFFKDHYAESRIQPWTTGDEEFFEFLRSHMRKIIALATPSGESHPRYLSKNNLNIARVGLLLKAFPDAEIVVPFRDPLQHAASLLRQHLNFLEIHADDQFARDYMAGIGHYDFGENLRPIDFGRWVDQAGDLAPSGLSFWLRYWIEAYSHLLDQDGIHLFCYEDLCANPRDSLQRLADILKPMDSSLILKVAERVSARDPHPVTLDSEAEALREKSQDLYTRLRNRSRD